jgi:hypothetical protein
VPTATASTSPSAQCILVTDPVVVGTASYVDGKAAGIEITAVWQFWLDFLIFLISHMDHFNSNYT